MIALKNEHYCHGGTVGYYSHKSHQTDSDMRFCMFSPPKDKRTGAYVVFLSGLTCTEDNFPTKAGAYAKAAELGLHVLVPDTSPRGDKVADVERYDLGQGAGFYLDATQAPWAKHFRMESYLMKELLPQCERFFELDASKTSIMGHSMGGHGALTLYFKYPTRFISCSAFAPIVCPTTVPWGMDAFRAYLGEDLALWKQHDATELVQACHDAQKHHEILIDQGLADPFLKEQLKPELFVAACKKAGQKLTLRSHPNYDHGYFFIQSFIEDHLTWHQRALMKGGV